jgi:predicted deacylase
MNRRPSPLSAEIDFSRDGKQTGFLRLPYSVHRSAYGWLPIPIASIVNGAGPRVLLMAGNHGDEYEGQVALATLIRALEPDEITGTLIILPSANFPAAMAGSRTSPLDEGNLNRLFPGDPEGGPTAQIADYIESELLPGCDFVLDMHSGGSSLTYIPSALMRLPETAEGRARAIEMLRNFGASSAAARAGVTHLGTELGGGGQVTPAALRVAHSGVRRFLAAAGVLRGKPPEPEAATRVMEIKGFDYYTYAPERGLFEPLVELGAEIAPDQPAAAIHCHDTPWREPAIARFSRAGTVICKRVPGRVERGDCLFHLASDIVA